MIVEQIVQYLNAKTGRNFRSKNADTRRHVSARIREGYSVEDFQRVIDYKTSQWLKDEKMSEHLVPKTLFGNKFDSYLNQSPPSNQKKETMGFERPLTDDEMEEYLRGK